MSQAFGHKGEYKMNKEFSWFLGMLATDGSIVRPSYRKKGDESHILFCMQCKDNEVLYKIKNILNTRSKVRLYPEYKSPQCQISIYDRKDIVDKYSDIKITVPSGVMPRHYIRGLVDGDGCLNYRFDRRQFRINIVNENYDILLYASKEISLALSCDLKTPKWKQQDNLYMIEWEGKIARLISWWLYHGDIQSCVLKRKLDYYTEFVLCDIKSLGRPDEVLMAIGDRGQYLINKHGDGVLVSMNTDSKNSLTWSKRMSKIIKRSTPVPVNSGKIKYYSLYIPIIDMRSIELDEDIVQ